MNPKDTNLIKDTTTAVENFNATEAGMARLTELYADQVFDCDDNKGMKLAKEARGEIRKPRFNIEKLRKAAKSPILDLGRSIDARAKELTAELLKLERPIDDQIKIVEQREAERLAAIEARMAVIPRLVSQANEAGLSSTQIGIHLLALTDLEINADLFAEFEVEALEKQNEALVQVRNRFESAKTREAEAAELETLRREKREREQADREAAEAAAVIVEEPTTIEEQIEDELAASDADAAPEQTIEEAAIEAGRNIPKAGTELPAPTTIADDFPDCVVVSEDAIDRSIPQGVIASQESGPTYPGRDGIAWAVAQSYEVDKAIANQWLDEFIDKETMPF